MILPQKNVLVVDVDRATRSALVHLFDRMGLPAHPAADADEALRAVDESVVAPRLAVINYRLPREDGLALCRRLRAIRPDSQMIVLTSVSPRFEPRLERAQEDREVDRVIELPWKIQDFRTLARRFGQILEGEALPTFARNTRAPHQASFPPI